MQCCYLNYSCSQSHEPIQFSSSFTSYLFLSAVSESGSVDEEDAAVSWHWVSCKKTDKDEVLGSELHINWRWYGLWRKRCTVPQYNLVYSIYKKEHLGDML